MAAADPSPTGDLELESTSRQNADDYYADDQEESRVDGVNISSSMRDKERKIGHRRVDKAGIVSYKKKPTSELMAAIQLGIGQSVGGLSSKPERDVLMQDFGVVEVVFFPGEGSNLTPAHHYSDFRFKTYAPVAFRYFRDLFGIQPEDFMLSLCNEPLKELSNPGASGSIFYLTHDDEFIIKTVQHKEAEFLQKLLPGYFLNISQNKRTLLPKFYGLYCYQCGGKNIRFTVMNNLLPSTVQLHEKYDMKGSTYKRKASKSERAKKAPTLKDLDFMENHPDCLLLEKDICDSLIKTLQRDCRVLESFKIMDYSLLVGIYNLDQLNKNSPITTENEVIPESINPSGLHRAKSIRTRIGQYSTPLESIQGNTDLTDDMDEDEDVPPGGIPARNAKGERILLYLGIIDILQSFRLKKRLEHTVKSMVIDGDTISVHRPSYYAQRFLQYHATRVFKKVPTALKHSPSKRRALNKPSKGMQTPGQTEQTEHSTTSTTLNPRSSRTISFSDEQNAPSLSAEAVGGKPPDLLPEYSKSVKRSPSPRSSHSRRGLNMNGNSMQTKRSDAFTVSTYPSEDAISAGTASTASLRAVGVGPSYPTHRGPSPPLSLSESTPTHTDFTEGTPSFTNSSPSCSSDVMASSKAAAASRSPSYPSTTTTTTTTTPAATTTTTTTNTTKTIIDTNETSVTFVLPSEEKDQGSFSQNMGGLSPLDGMDSPTTYRSPDLHHRKMVQSEKTGVVVTGWTSSSVKGEQQTESPSHSFYPTSKDTMGATDVTVLVIPESPPPPFEAVVGNRDDQPPTATHPPSQRKGDFATTAQLPSSSGDVATVTAAAVVEVEEDAADEDEMTRL